MLTTQLIRDKREGRELSAKQWQWLIDGYTRGEVTDPQMAAMAMAICIRGLATTETAHLTQSMWRSGESLPRVTDRPRVDKHSTGGLGDKVSLLLAPMLACCDVDVPMISGRGLGRTGGTLDKLESIPGFNVNLDADQSAKVLREVGAFIISASERIAPADRKLYALRDVTATVESVGLITASILSKKLSASLDALVMDVKVGSGAFMPDQASAETLARSLVTVGNQAGLPVAAMLTDMDQPLGAAVGNALEVNETLEVLRGGGSARVRDLTILLAARSLVMCGRDSTIAAAKERLRGHLDSGLARERFEQMVAAQGGRLNGPLDVAPGHEVIADRDGWVESIDGEAIGDRVIEMGGGRRKGGDAIDPHVGLTMGVEIGDRVSRGQVLLRVHHRDAKNWPEGNFVKLSERPIEPRPLILQEIS